MMEIAGYLTLTYNNSSGVWYARNVGPISNWIRTQVSVGTITSTSSLTTVKGTPCIAAQVNGALALFKAAVPAPPTSDTFIAMTVDSAAVSTVPIVFDGFGSPMIAYKTAAGHKFGIASSAALFATLDYVAISPVD
jgi:hypothetical protein